VRQLGSFQAAARRFPCAVRIPSKVPANPSGPATRGTQLAFELANPSFRRTARMTIESLLSRPVSTLSSKATCAEAARRMKRQNIGSIVIERDGVPVGILTDRDLTVRLVAEELDGGSITVDRVMSTFPVFLTPQRDLRAALEVMVEMGVRRLPAVNSKGRVVGILSLDDILIELTGQLGQVQKLLQRERGASAVDNEIVD
jgi:CBS domain-containing protein